jgi:nucleoside-diphosphate-sugar epimerase
MDSSKLNKLRWQAKVTLGEGLKMTYQKALKII